MPSKERFGPSTTIKQLAQVIFADKIDGKDIPKDGQFFSTIQDVIDLPSKDKGFVASFDPFWDSNDDKTRFKNDSLISYPKDKRIAYTRTLPIFDLIVVPIDLPNQVKPDSFTNSFLLRIPYNESQNNNQELQIGNNINIRFKNPGTLSSPEFVKKTVDKESPTANPAAQTSTKKDPPPIGAE